ncbi:hypothetical protein ACVW1C_002688 [Bradyrhizobium sp. USDA 4011]
MLLAGGLEYGQPGPMPLPGTKTEIEAIAKLARARGAPVEMLTGRGVSEAAPRERVGGVRAVRGLRRGPHIYGARALRRRIMQGRSARAAGNLL